MELNDSVLEHLRQVTASPDLSGSRYELQEEIGRGGLGVVYAALDTVLHRRVALKVMDAAFAEEAGLIAQLEHPSIVPIYDAGTLADGRSFYAMKLISGRRLDDTLTGDAPMSERLRILRHVGEALAFAHSRGVLHRDLKPQNIMVGNFGEVYVMDWGIARVAGTPGFRAPEPEFTLRSDIYGLGALLEWALPSTPPRALLAIAAKAMAADPNARYQGVSELLDDLQRYQDGLAVQAWSEPWGHRVRRFTERNALVLVLLAAYLVVKFAIFFLPRP